MPQTEPSSLADRLSAEFADMLTETFEQVAGMYLDHGTSLFETLATVDARTASQPVSKRCASIAAQVHHLTYYIDVTLAYAAGTPPTDVDWPGSWQQTTVDDASWAAECDALRAAYKRVRDALDTSDNWPTRDAIGGILNIIVHTAYHLGEIRQGLGVLQPSLVG